MPTARRPLRRLLAAALATAVLPMAQAAPASAADAELVATPSEYWQHIGYSFPACQDIVWRPNLAGARQPEVMRDLLQQAVDRWNAAIGKPVMSLGQDTTSSADRRFDGINTIEVQTSSSTGFGGVGGPSSISRGGRSEITEGDVRIFDSSTVDLDETAREILLLSMVHEIGHAIGFLHTIEPSSPMSYVGPADGAIDPETAKVVNFLLAGPCADRHTVRNPLDLFDAFARDKEVDFGHVGSSLQPLLHGGATDVVSAGVALADMRRAEGPALTRAVICRADAFPDCLAGSALAGRDGMVLFVPGGPDGRLPSQVRDQLERAFAGNRAAADVIIAGGTNAVSDGVRADIEAAGYTVRRLRGLAPNADRYGTAEVIAQDVVARNGGSVDTVLLARGDNPADAMTAGVVAARDGLPLVLTTPGALPEVTRAALERWRPRRIVLLGGTAAVGQAVAAQVAEYADTVERLRGRERTATSVAIARGLAGYVAIDEEPRPITLLNGRHPEAWALAIGYAPLGAVQDSPILLVEPNGFLPPTPEEPGVAPGSGTYLAELDLSPTHDGQGRRVNDAFFRTLGTSSGVFTDAAALKFANQILLYCQWYRDDCFQQGLTNG